MGWPYRPILLHTCSSLRFRNEITFSPRPSYFLFASSHFFRLSLSTSSSFLLLLTLPSYLLLFLLLLSLFLLPPPPHPASPSNPSLFLFLVFRLPLPLLPLLLPPLLLVLSLPFIRWSTVYLITSRAYKLCSALDYKFQCRKERNEITTSSFGNIEKKRKRKALMLLKTFFNWKRAFSMNKAFGAEMFRQ